MRDIIEQTQQECFEGEGGPIHDVEEIHAAYQTFVEQVMEACGAHAGCVVFTDPSNPSEFERIVSVGYGDDFKWWRTVRVGDGIVSAALNDYEIHVDYPISHHAYKPLNPKTRGQVTIPIRLGKQPDAAACFEYPGVPALDQAEAEEIQRQLRAFFLSSRYVIRSARVDRVFYDTVRLSKVRDHDQFLDICMELLQYFAGGGEIAIVERENDELIVSRHSGIGKDNLSKTKNLRIGVAPREGYVCAVAKSHVSFYCRDTDDRAKYELYRPVVPTTKSQHTMPLISSGVLLGVLNVGARHPYAFSASDRQLLEMVASAIANALHDSRVADNIFYNIDQAKGRLIAVREDLIGQCTGRPRAGGASELGDKVDDAITMIALTTAPIAERQVRQLSVSELGSVLVEALKDLIDQASLAVALPPADESQVIIAPSAVTQSVRSMIYWVSYGTKDPSPHWEARVGLEMTRDIFGGESVMITCCAWPARASKRRTRLRDLLRSDSIASRWQCDYLAAQFGGYLGKQRVAESNPTQGANSSRGHALSLTIPCSKEP